MGRGSGAGSQGGGRGGAGSGRPPPHPRTLPTAELKPVVLAGLQGAEAVGPNGRGGERGWRAAAHDLILWQCGR